MAKNVLTKIEYYVTLNKEPIKFFNTYNSLNDEGRAFQLRDEMRGHWSTATRGQWDVVKRTITEVEEILE